MLRDWLAYAGMRLLVTLLRLLPLDVATAVGARAGRILGPRINPKRHRLALSNLAVAFPRKTAEERHAICMAHWENMGRVLVEATQIDRILADPGRIRFKDGKVLSRYLGKLGPAVGVSLHMGNWELATWPFVANGLDPAALYRAQPNRYIDAYLRRQREALYPGGLFSRGKGDDESDARTGRAIMHFVRNGGRLGIVCDQHYKNGIPVRLFGRMTRTQPMAAIIARRLGVRIWMTRCLRVGSSSRFEIVLKELRVPRTNNQADDIRSIMEAMYRQFEEWVAEAPEQWVWTNRKWPQVADAPVEVDRPALVPDLAHEAMSKTA